MHKILIASCLRANAATRQANQFARIGQSIHRRRWFVFIIAVAVTVAAAATIANDLLVSAVHSIPFETRLFHLLSCRLRFFALSSPTDSTEFFIEHDQYTKPHTYRRVHNFLITIISSGASACTTFLRTRHTPHTRWPRMNGNKWKKRDTISELQMTLSFFD